MKILKHYSSNAVAMPLKTPQIWQKNSAKKYQTKKMNYTQ